MKVENGKLVLYSLEVFLTDKCNLRCEHCSASSPFLADANLPSLERFSRALRCLTGVLRCGQVKFVGGEPLLNRDICRFLREARASGMFGALRVTTNGSLLTRMTDEFWQLVDIVEISLYPGTAAPSAAELAAFERQAARFDARLESHEIRHFMQAVSATRNEDPELVERVFSTCGEAHHWSCHLLYEGRLYRCSRVHSLDRYLGLLGVEHEPFTLEDGLPIDDRASLLDDLRDYLGSSEPLKACSFCLGTSGVWERNRQMTAEEIRAAKRERPEPFDRRRLVTAEEARWRNRVQDWVEAKGVTPLFDPAFRAGRPRDGKPEG